jgi:hypothetical protein
MTCTGTQPFDQLDCAFTVISLKEEDNKSDRKLAALLKVLPDAEARELLQQTCSNLAEIRKQITAAKSRWTVARYTAATEDLHHFEKLCTCRTRGCWLSTLSAAPIPKRCKLHASTYTDVHFTRVGIRKWSSTQGPEANLCHDTSIITIEHEPDDIDKWTYTETTVPGNTDSEFCRKSAALPRENIASFRFTGPLRVSCTAITFTPW